MPIEYKVVDDTLRVDVSNWASEPTLEDSDISMAAIIDKLREARAVERIVLEEAREIEYDEEQTKLLKEIADVYERLLEKVLSPKNLGLDERLIRQRFTDVRILLELLKRDPIGAYIKVSRMIEERAEQLTNPDVKHYVTNALLPIKQALEETELIRLVKDKLGKYRFGDRSLYRTIFNPIIRPGFMLTRYVLLPPRKGRLVERYRIPGAIVEIYQVPGEVRYLYHITPKEFLLSEEKHLLLSETRKMLIERGPKETEVKDLEVMRDRFLQLSRILVREVASRMGISISQEEVDELANIITRYTAGFGILEVLLADEKIQDIYINAPIGSTPIYVNHEKFGECKTNLIPTQAEAESWATKFRLYSGRPLDEANPVLDTTLVVPGGRARVAAITRTLSPGGLAFAFRRHRESPWTYPLFLKARSFNPLYAGLMSFVIDGGRAIMFAGGRGSGKTSLLSASILEIMRKFRIIIQEDTPELPIDMYRKLGYNVLQLKSRSIITHVETELSPEEALRTALRLGDSVLIVGEVRSKESTVLFEAMRIGALANVVAGTIHGESAYGVYDRVVHDLGVTPTSFKALDLISISNILKTPDGLKSFRRVTELTEVRKKWKEDPLEEGGFVPLMQYSAKEDELKPTETLINGESEVLNAIAKRTREWHGAWDRVWDNILLRAKIKKTIVDFAVKLNRPEILEAEWTVATNEAFHLISNQVLEEVGAIDSKLVYERWLDWFKERLKHGELL